MKSVAVLGCGPAGLLAAHAVKLAGLTPDIWSVKSKSKIGGAQYLHTAIPDLTPDMPDGQVNFIKWGQPGYYAERVYGNGLTQTSWDTFRAGLHDVWDMREAYDQLWEMYEHLIIEDEIGPKTLEALLTRYSIVISAIPLRPICGDPEHRFTSQDVWIVMGRATCEPMTIVYNGLPFRNMTAQWYRESNIFGHPSQEYAFDVPNSRHIQKPLWTNCDCWINLHRVGRYGEWKKEVLISDAFKKSVRILAENGYAAHKIWGGS